jgi:hypothetical protein
MKQVEIYDNYTSTVVTECTGFTTVQGTNLSEADANAMVVTLYNEAKNLGTYTDKIIKLDQGYAELKIDLPPNKSLNRVIYTIDV